MLGGNIMANYCNYEIHVKGTKKAALFMYAMMPVYDYKQIIHEEGTEEEYIVWMEGDCKWQLDAYCEEKADVKIDVEAFTEEYVRNEENGLDYWYLTMRQKSEVLGIEVLAHSWSRESEFENFEHYKKGTLISEKATVHILPEELDDWELFPKWIKAEYESYESFCKGVKDFFDFDISGISEELWEEEEEGVYILPEDNWLDFSSDYEYDLYPSAGYEFDF